MAARAIACTTCPALIVWGLADGAFRPDQLARWRQALPQARVVELPGAGHWPHEEEPEAVVASVRGFVDASRASSKGAAEGAPRDATTA